MPQEYLKFADHWKTRVEEVIALLLPDEDAAPPELCEAMRYAVLGGGKRIRAMLVVMAAQACRGKAEETLPAAAAVECVHAYSLVHDDLPAMDDDDLRRGRPTCHKAFSEAMAILAGDGLLTHAFEILAAEYRPDIAAALVRCLARGAGPRGMVGGQALDILSEGAGLAGSAALERVMEIHEQKTGALISVAAEMGAITARADTDDRDTLASFGMLVGRAFQAIDDVLDETASPEDLGKATLKDRGRGKLTLPGAASLEAARAEAKRLSHEALGAIAPLGARGKLLASFGRFLLNRKN
jgi:geranylgeranyl pyrophosphate synthase